MALTHYQHLVLQEIGIQRFSCDIDESLDSNKLTQNKLSENNSQENKPSKQSHAVLVEPLLIPVLANDTSMYADISSLLTKQQQSSFKWVQAEGKTEITFEQDLLTTPVIADLTAAHKKQIWHVISSSFDALQWS